MKMRKTILVVLLFSILFGTSAATADAQTDEVGETKIVNKSWNGSLYCPAGGMTYFGLGGYHSVYLDDYTFDNVTLQNISITVRSNTSMSLHIYDQRYYNSSIWSPYLDLVNVIRICNETFVLNATHFEVEDWFSNGTIDSGWTSTYSNGTHRIRETRWRHYFRLPYFIILANNTSSNNTILHLDSQVNFKLDGVGPGEDRDIEVLFPIDVYTPPSSTTSPSTTTNPFTTPITNGADEPVPVTIGLVAFWMLLGALLGAGSVAVVLGRSEAHIG